jgi:hypothetical protein
MASFVIQELGPSQTFDDWGRGLGSGIVAAPSTRAFPKGGAASTANYKKLRRLCIFP